MKPLSFQEIIMRLDQFWSEHGCVVAEPFDVEVGAGTMAPATFLRVLGPEPWSVAYPQPSRRPADGRYAENPNRYQHYFQYQVVLKPSPADPLGLYLESIRALGLSDLEHDIRFVEDNWENPSLGAWGLGWEVWLDGLEITQFTYFQQCGSLDLDPPSVEITYGLERIAMYLQGVGDFVDIRWSDRVTYGELYRQSEIEQSTYNFEIADIETLRTLFDLYEREAQRVIAAGLVVPAHELVLKCSHVFNLLDSRGAIGVTQRANYLGRMRPLARRVASAYVAQREALGYPLARTWTASPGESVAPESAPAAAPGAAGAPAAQFLLEVGTEELPASDLAAALEQIGSLVPGKLRDLGLKSRGIRVSGTPRRLVLEIDDVGAEREEEEELVKGPPATAAFDAEGRPTRAAEGFARSAGVSVADLQVADFGGRGYAVVRRRTRARPTPELLGQLARDVLADLHFARPMYWAEPTTTFSRPIRWVVALWGDRLVPVSFAGVTSGRQTMPPRGVEQRPVAIESTEAYHSVIAEFGIQLDVGERRATIVQRGRELAASVGGVLDEDESLLAEVANLVERPEVMLGSFDEAFLEVPAVALVTVMKKHQRYLPVHGANGTLLPRFVVAANGPRQRPDLVLHGYEEVLRARFADALYFYRQDIARRLEEFVPQLGQLTFLEGLGSMLDKTERLRRLAPLVAESLGLSVDARVLDRAALLAKADLASSLVRELTELQGEIGCEYALKSGEDPAVAEAIREHHLPRFSGDSLPRSDAGLALAVADRLDTLVSGFAVGLEPTGSSDPYGLRRAALGVILAIIDRGAPVSLDALVATAASHAPIPLDRQRAERLAAFFNQRLRVHLLEQGHRAEFVDAVLAALGDRPSLAERTVRALSREAETEAFQRLMAGIRRADRIVPRDGDLSIDRDALTEPAEFALYEAYERAARALAATPPDQVGEIVRAMLPLTDPIDRFFDEVLVMAEDPRVRRARLALLKGIRDLPSRSFDVSRLPGPPSR